LSRLVLVTALVALAAAASASAAPRRVVALTPFTANTLADVGVRPIAVGQTVGGTERFAPALRGVRRIPLSHPNGPNLEQLATLNPGLVLSAPIWRKGAASMRRLGIRVAESDPRTVHALPAETVRVGKLVGRSRQARRQADRIRRSVRAATRGIRRRPSVLVVLGVGRTSYAFLANSWGGDVVTRAGGRLLTQGLRAPGGYARISDELVVRRNPDVIIAVPHGNAKGIARLARYLRDNPAWRKTRAARHNRIYVSSDNRLLQASTDIGTTIDQVRRRFLRNR